MKLRKFIFRIKCQDRLENHFSIFKVPYSRYSRKEIPIIILKRFLNWFFTQLNESDFRPATYEYLIDHTVYRAEKHVEVAIHLGYLLLEPEIMLSHSTKNISYYLNSPLMPLDLIFDCTEKAIKKIGEKELAYNTKFIAYCVYSAVQRSYVYSASVLGATGVVLKEAENKKMDKDSYATEIGLKNLESIRPAIEKDGFNIQEIEKVAREIMA